jgi:hypothetical protein
MQRFTRRRTEQQHARRWVCVSSKWIGIQMSASSCQLLLLMLLPCSLGLAFCNHEMTPQLAGA